MYGRRREAGGTMKLMEKYIGPVVRHTFTLEQIEEADENMSGFCVSCGEEQGGCEPDARHYTCEVCGEKGVFGAAELVLMGMVK